MRNFKDGIFFYCYDCGWGEKGVHESYLTYEAAFDIIKDRSGEDTANKWAEDEDPYFEFHPTSYYIIEESMFDRDDWEGSQDY